MTPRPDDDAAFLHGILQGLGSIESKGYDILNELGASPLKSVTSCGGGANNPTWQQIRAHMLRVPVSKAQYTEAALGTSRLALHAGII